MQPFDSGLTFTYLTGLPTNELEDRLASLPPRSAVYYLRVSRGRRGQQRSIRWSTSTGVAAAANAPTYCWVDSAMGHGIVGGSLYSQGAAIARVGQLALRVLGGEPADSIPTAALIDLNCESGRLAPAPAMGHRRSAASCRDGGQVSRTRRIWDRYKALHPGRSHPADHAVGAHCRPVDSTRDDDNERKRSCAEARPSCARATSETATSGRD